MNKRLERNLRAHYAPITFGRRDVAPVCPTFGHNRLIHFSLEASFFEIHNFNISQGAATYKKQTRTFLPVAGGAGGGETLVREDGTWWAPRATAYESKQYLYYKYASHDLSQNIWVDNLEGGVWRERRYGMNDSYMWATTMNVLIRKNSYIIPSEPNKNIDDFTITTSRAPWRTKVFCSNVQFSVSSLSTTIHYTYVQLATRSRQRKMKIWCKSWKNSTELTWEHSRHRKTTAVCSTKFPNAFWIALWHDRHPCSAPDARGRPPGRTLIKKQTSRSSICHVCHMQDT